MLDIKLIRENPELVKSNLEKRGNPENLAMLQELIETDKKWREDLTRLNDLRHDRKVCTQEIATLKKAKQDAQSQVEKAKAIDAEITAMEKEVTQIEAENPQLPNDTPQPAPRNRTFWNKRRRQRGSQEMGKHPTVHLHAQKPHRLSTKPGHSGY